MRRVSEEDRNKIVELYTQDNSADTIAKLIPTTRDIVYDELKRENIQRRTNKKNHNVLAEKS